MQCCVPSLKYPQYPPIPKLKGKVPARLAPWRRQRAWLAGMRRARVAGPGDPGPSGYSGARLAHGRTKWGAGTRGWAPRSRRLRDTKVASQAAAPHFPRRHLFKKYLKI